MSMLYVEHETDTAHRLSCHKGKCRNLHGHRYKFVIGFRVEGTIEDGEKFKDFYEVKKEVRSVLDDIFDHGTILKICPENVELINLLKSMGMKVYEARSEPTVEWMVMFVADLLQADEVTIYETPTNYCTYKRAE